MKMIANREQCLEPAALTDLLAGRLPPERFASALQHVESCDRCTQAAEVAGSGSAFSWIEQAVKATDHAGFSHEPECQAVVGNLLLQPKSRNAGNSGASVLPTETLGPYRLLKWLGSGGMGSVYLAEHQRLKRMAAIKLLPRERLLQSGWLERFNREMTSIAALAHPHVVRAIDAGDEGGWHFLVMEYLDGADLSKVCRRMSDIPLPTACELVRQAALGLGAIHSLGMTHRDIKPSNLFLTRTGVVKLLDLGLVLSGDSPLAADERLTTVGHLMGTVPYMAREQLVDASSVDWRADIYSLGATLFRLLTGRAPFGPATNLAQTIQALSTTPCPPLKSLKPDVPAEVSQLVDRMLSHDPARRPQSAQEVAELLSPFCDASAPQSLIRAALNCPDDQDEQPSSQLQNSQLQPCAQVDGSSGKSKSRWPKWIAAAFIPLAFFAGILITVTTDKGTLVIESDEPGVSVKVTQGDKVVESLRVEKQASVLRLHSGKYIVELTGVDGDGLEISDSKVALTRGEKQVVRIQQRRNATDAEAIDTDSKENQFQGKSLAHWMNLLSREKDVATIAQAMQAVSLLAETEQERLEAARKCMFIARRLGGIVMTGRPDANNANPFVSGWFMTELVDIYPKFFPEPGLQVIIEELEHGTERSAQTCFLFLSAFSTDETNVFIAMPSNSLQVYTEMARSDSGRAQLRKLEKLLKTEIVRSKQATETAEPTDYLAAGHRFIADGGVLCRIDVLRALGDDISNDPQAVEWAQKTLATALDAIERKQAPRGGMGGMIERSPLIPRIALTTQEVLGKLEYNTLPVLLAYLEPAGNVKEADLTTAFTNMAKDKPNEAAAAIVKHFERAQQSSGFFGLISQSDSTARVKIAKETLLATPPESIQVVKALAHALEVSDPTSIFKKEDIEDLLRDMAVRLTREANVSGDANAVMKDDLAIHIFVKVGIPEEQLQEVVDLLQGRDREQVQNMPISYSITRHIDDLLRGNQREPALNSLYVNDGLKQLFESYPRQFIETYAKQLRSVNHDIPRLLVWPPMQPLLRIAVKRLTPVERRLDAGNEMMTEPQAKTLEALFKFLKTPESVAVIQQLDEAYQLALAQVVATYADKNSSDESVEELSNLLHDRLTIARYLGKDVESESAVQKGFVMAGWPVELEQLQTYEKESGYKSIAFYGILQAAISIQTSTDGEQFAHLIEGVYDSRPVGFRKFFIDDLEQSAARFEKGVRVNFLGGELDAACGVWYQAILKPLFSDPATRPRAIAAIKKIVDHLPPESKHFLEDLLPKPL